VSSIIRKLQPTQAHLPPSSPPKSTHLQAPQLDINTVAAGGGSRLHFRAGLFAVGPDSAGAHPGPVCYKKGGHLAITDANLALGRILPDFFPKIFGPGEVGRDAWGLGLPPAIACVCPYVLGGRVHVHSAWVCQL
jgi:hypothetical protein